MTSQSFSISLNPPRHFASLKLSLVAVNVQITNTLQIDLVSKLPLKSMGALWPTCLYNTLQVWGWTAFMCSGLLRAFFKTKQQYFARNISWVQQTGFFSFIFCVLAAWIQQTTLQRGLRLTMLTVNCPEGQKTESSYKVLGSIPDT